MSEKVFILSSAGRISGARLHRIANTLNGANFEVHVIAPGDQSGTPDNTVFHRTTNRKSKLARIHRDLTLPLRANGDIYLTLSPDLIPLTYLIAKLRRKKFICDLNEDYLKLLKDRSWAKGFIGTIAKLVAWLGNKIAAQADLLIVADDQVPPFKAKNRLVVRNYPDARMIPDSGEMENKPRAIYIGDIRKTRGLQAMLELAEQTPSWNYDFIGPISPLDQDFVNEWKVKSQASARVKFHGVLNPKDSWLFAKGAWIGLTLLESTPAFIEAVPSKLYEYLYSGLAAISTPLPRCIEIIERSKGGVISHDVAQAARVMNEWATNPLPLIEMRSAAKNWAHKDLGIEEHYATFVAAVKAL